MKMRRIFSRKTEFRARSPGRDTQTDSQNILPVLQAIETALQAFTAESAGLDARIAAVNLRASFMIGNNADEYLSRDAADTEQLRQVETEFKNAQKRLDVLQDHIAKLQCIRSIFVGKFPNAS